MYGMHEILVMFMVKYRDLYLKIGYITDLSLRIIQLAFFVYLNVTNILFLIEMASKLNGIFI